MLISTPIRLEFTAVHLPAITERTPLDVNIFVSSSNGDNCVNVFSCRLGREQRDQILESGQILALALFSFISCFRQTVGARPGVKEASSVFVETHMNPTLITTMQPLLQ